MQNTINLLRDLIADFLVSGRTPATYRGTSKIFNIYDENVDESTLVVYKNGSLYSGSGLYSFDVLTNSVTVTGTLATNDTLLFIYSYYKKYSDEELSGWIRSSLYHISCAKYNDFIVASGDVIIDSDGTTVPTIGEYRLIALIAKILIDPDMTSYRTSEVQISFNKTDTKEQKIEKLINQFKSFGGTFSWMSLDETDPPSED